MKISLPAWQYTKFYHIKGTMQYNGNCCTFRLDAELKDVKNLLDLVHTPVEHNNYIVSIDISHLFDKLCNYGGTSCGAGETRPQHYPQRQNHRPHRSLCGYGVIKKSRNKASNLWDTYGIFLLSGCKKSGEEDKSPQFYTLITKVASATVEDADFKWLVLITDIDLRDCQCVEFVGSGLRHRSKEVFVESLDRLATYPRLYVDEISYIPHQSTGIAQAGTAAAEVVYIGSQVAVKGRLMQIFLPVLVRYDVEGVDPPRHIFPSARVYLLRIQLSVDDMYRLVREVLIGSNCNWKAVVKVLSQNAVARSLRSLCEGYKGWIFEREISTEILGRNITFTTPNFWRIEKLYKRIYLDAQNRKYKCDTSSLKSLLMRWQDVVYEIKRNEVEKCKYAKDTTWVEYFSECIEKDSYGSFSKCVEDKVQKMRDVRGGVVRNVIFSFFESFALWSLLLGAHGVAHMALKSVAKGRRGGAEYAELVDVKLPRNSFQRAFNNLHFYAQGGAVEIDGLFRIEMVNSDRADVVIKVFDLTARSSLNLDDLLNSVKQQKMHSNRCDRAFEEEKSRLERAFQVLKSSYGVLAQLDDSMRKLPEEVAPPRFIFRFLIPKIRRRQQLELHQFKLFQYVWPRYVHSCADGCYLCVLVPRHLCVYPPSQAEFKTSKTYALGLL